jgi:hypothetical protein
MASRKKPSAKPDQGMISKLRKRRFEKYLHRDRGTPLERGWEQTKLFFKRGNFYSTIRTMGVIGASAGSTLAVTHPKPQYREAGLQIAAASGAVVTAAEVARFRTRQKYRADISNLRNIERIRESENPERMRLLDRELVRLYSRIPDHVEKNLGGTPESAADHFRSLRGLRISPDSEYRLHMEDPQYRELVKPVFQYMVTRLPNNPTPKALLEKHFPKEKLNPISEAGSLALPRGLETLVPPRLLESRPQNEREAMGVALLAASVARAREKGFRERNGLSTH